MGAFCTNCGNPINEENLYCEQCGTKVVKEEKHKINYSKKIADNETVVKITNVMKKIITNKKIIISVLLLLGVLTIGIFGFRLIENASEKKKNEVEELVRNYVPEECVTGISYGKILESLYEDVYFRYVSDSDKELKKYDKYFTYISGEYVEKDIPKGKKIEFVYGYGVSKDENLELTASVGFYFVCEDKERVYCIGSIDHLSNEKNNTGVLYSGDDLLIPLMNYSPEEDENYISNNVDDNVSSADGECTEQAKELFKKWQGEYDDKSCNGTIEVFKDDSQFTGEVYGIMGRGFYGLYNTDCIAVEGDEYYFRADDFFYKIVEENNCLFIYYGSSKETCNEMCGQIGDSEESLKSDNAREKAKLFFESLVGQYYDLTFEGMITVREEEPYGFNNYANYAIEGNGFTTLYDTYCSDIIGNTYYFELYDSCYKIEDNLDKGFVAIYYGSSKETCNEMCGMIGRDETSTSDSSEYVIPYCEGDFSKIGQTFSSFHVAGTGLQYSPGSLAILLKQEYPLNCPGKGEYYECWQAYTDYNEYASRVGVYNDRIVFNIQDIAEGTKVSESLPSDMLAIEPLVIYGYDDYGTVKEQMLIWRGDNGYSIAFAEVSGYPNSSYLDEYIKFCISTVDLMHIYGIPQEVIDVNPVF